MRILCLTCWWCLVCSAVSYAQVRPLETHLTATAAHYELGLVFSPGGIPDTSIVFELAEYGSASEAFSRLTKPFGLQYAVLGRQVIVSTLRNRRYSASGFVEDVATGERLVGASVSLLRANRGVATNGYGYFSVAGLEDGERLIVSYVGYPSDTLTITSQDMANVRVRLRPSYKLSVVEVVADAGAATTVPITDRPVTPRVLEDAEFSIGDRDVNAWLGQRAGVLSGPGGFGGYSIRGADPNQNLVIVDDATLYLPSHAAGYVSAIPGDAIRSLKLSKHAGEARYGDRVGGVLDIRLKEGSREGRKSMFSVGITDLRASTEGPLGKGSYFLAARRGLTDFWLQALRPSVQPRESSIPNINFLFYDFTGKVNLPLSRSAGATGSPKQRLYASVYVGRDRYADQDEIFFNDGSFIDAFLDQSVRSWGNAVASLRHNAAVGTRWFINTTATLSEFNYDASDYFLLTEAIRTSSERYTYSQSAFATNLLDIGLKQNFDVALRPRLALDFGFDGVAHRFRVGTQTETVERALQFDTTGGVGQQIGGNELPVLRTYDVAGYVSANWQPVDALVVDAGLRLASQLGGERRFASLLPRVKVAYDLVPGFGVSISGGMARQYIHSISTQNPGLPRDLWVPSVAGLSPQRSSYLTGTLSFDNRRGCTAALSAYYQRINGLARFSNNFTSLRLDQWVDNLRNGEGESSGIEVQGVTMLSTIKLQASYSLAWATRRYQDSEGGAPIEERFRLDRRHYARLGARVPISKSWTTGLTWIFGSGAPTRLPTLNPIGPQIPDTNVPLTNSWIYDGPQIQLAPYHSLDLGVVYQRMAERVDYKVTFGVQNIYLRKNPLFLNLQRTSTSGAGQSNYEFTQITMLPFLPFLRYSVAF